MVMISIFHRQHSCTRIIVDKNTAMLEKKYWKTKIGFYITEYYAIIFHAKNTIQIVTVCLESKNTCVCAMNMKKQLRATKIYLAFVVAIVLSILRRHVFPSQQIGKHFHAWSVKNNIL